jgi:hypothetical protein
MKSMGRVLDLSESTVKLTLSKSSECVEEGKAASASFSMESTRLDDG